MSPKMRKLLCSAAFAFCTGFVDILCVARFSAFGTMMTGNILQFVKTVVASGLVVQAGDDYIPQPIFFLIIILWRTIGLFLFRVTQSPKICVMISWLLVITSGLYQYQHDPASGPPLYPARWNVWFVALSFGVQSSVTFKAGLPVTMLVTGHLTAVTAAYMDKCLDGADLEKTHIPTGVIMGMSCGMLVGGVINLYVVVGPPGELLFIPMIIVQGVMLMSLEAIMDPKKTAAREKDSDHCEPLLLA